MDSVTLLDYVLFQLTPTRTRCDLVIFSGKKNEKLASGLLQPFISHLKSAQDQISRGGYSITLRPSTPQTSWFTKATLERFVKFVSSPEVVERFVTIEREIVQIESSFQPNEQPSVASEAEVESNGNGDTSRGEDSKVCLRRVLETRKAVLRKEQAMAYARAIVSGFEADCLEDLISFANAFGALRLREACVDFLELCNKKRDDGVWKHEVAAMQACSASELPYFGKSGIVLGGEEKLYNQDTMMNQNESASHHADNGLASTWQNHFPQYLQHFPGYFPGNIPWPLNVDDSTPNIHHGMNPREDDGNENSDSDNNYFEHKQKNSSSNNHRKGSSKTIVIRNINYVTSRRNEEKDSTTCGGDSSSTTDDDSHHLVAADSIKRQIEQAVGSSHNKKKRDGKKRHSSKNREGVENADDIGTPQEDSRNKNLGIFQDLLMKEPDSPTVRIQQQFFLGDSFNAQTEGLSKQHAPSNDSFIVTERNIHVEDQVHLWNFGAGETIHLVNRGGNSGEELLFSNRTREMDSYSGETLSIGTTETVIIRSQKEEDWFKGNQPDLSSNGGFNSIFKVGDNTTEKNKKDVVLADDSFIVQTNSVGKTSDYQPPADIFMVSDIIGANQPKHNILDPVKSMVEATDVNEPDDLCMVLERDGAIDQVGAPWNPEMDYENDLKRHPDSQTNSVNLKLPQNDKVPNTRDRTRGEKGVRKETSSRTSVGNLARSKSEITWRIKKSPSVKSKSVKEEESRKKMEELALQRQRRIAERSTGTVVSNRRPTSNKTMKESKIRSMATPVKYQASTGEAEKLHKPICRSSTIDRLATARITHLPSTESPNRSSRKTITRENGVVAGIEKKTNHQKVKPSDKSCMNNSNMTSSLVKESSNEGRPRANEVDDFRDIKELPTISSVEKIENRMISSSDTFVNENCDQMSNGRFSMPNEDQSVQPQDLKVSNEIQYDDIASIKISPTEISTHPPSDEVKLKTHHSRKKWITGGDSPQVTKSIRKFLLFGQES